MDTVRDLSSPCETTLRIKLLLERATVLSYVSDPGLIRISGC